MTLSNHINNTELGLRIIEDTQGKTNPDDTLVSVNGLSKSFGAIEALRSVNIQLQPGKIGLVGNNGAGKSTLLKILLGLLTPDQGEGSVMGIDFRRHPLFIRRKIGYMPERDAVVPLLKGVEFVALSGMLYGMSRKAAMQRSHEVLSYCGLGELRYRMLQEYSTGNQQKLKLAAALVHDPELLLLDEPSSGLDPAGQVAFSRMLEDLIKASNKSVILSTHSLQEVEKMCDQVIVMHQGQVKFAGAMSDLPKNPRSSFRIQCVGEMESFIQALSEKQVECKKGRAEQWTISSKNAFNSQMLFQLAAGNNVAITRLEKEEERFEDLFFQLTQNETSETKGVTQHVT